MRIISPFRDYYDCMLRHGNDNDLIYLRNPEILNDIKVDRSLGVCFFSLRNAITRRVAIFFCGKIYRKTGLIFLDDETTDLPDNALLSVKELEFKEFSTAEEFKELCSPYFSKRQIAIFNQKGRYSSLAESVEKRLKDWEMADLSFMEEISQKYRTPIVVLEVGHVYHRVEINSNLSDYHFERLVDPATAFQELSMFLGNIANPEKPIPVMDDKTMLQIKGFDKRSFKKEPRK